MKSLALVLQENNSQCLYLLMLDGASPVLAVQPNM